jgi:lipopolysaccharide/colanic/teichoic acid biosynthesis glycosyltransferase
MVEKSESLKSKVESLNEADGPVFKIKNDPRYTRVGKFLSRLALDELPQLMNIIEGTMAFVGPRPLPLTEAKSVPKKYNSRFSILPGMTSPWIVQGAHTLSFKRWMELDVEYIQKRTIFGDFLIILKTLFVIGAILLRLSFFRRSAN